MNVLCRLGKHQARPMARWNGGYYFSTCTRCGQDLVRTPFEGWHAVPDGYRVVWSPAPPERVLAAQLDRAGSEPPAPGAVSEVEAEPEVADPEAAAAAERGLPISEVLRLLRDETPPEPQDEPPVALELTDQSSAEAPEPAASSGPELSEMPEEPVGGFMTETPEPSEEPAELAVQDAGDPFWGDDPVLAGDEPIAPAVAADEAPAAQDTAPEPQLEADSEATEVPLSEVEADADANEATLPEEEPSSAPEAAAHAVEAEAPAEDNPPPVDTASSRPGTTEERSERVAWPSAAPTQVRTPIIGMETTAEHGDRTGLLVAAIAVLGLIALFFAFRGPAPNAPPVRQASAPPSLKGNPGTPAFVSARLLNCRESPVDRARSRRVLARGDQVRVLAREPGWASVVFEGRQCWVADRFISAERPL